VMQPPLAGMQAYSLPGLCQHAVCSHLSADIHRLRVGNYLPSIGEFLVEHKRHRVVGKVVEQVITLVDLIFHTHRHTILQACLCLDQVLRTFLMADTRIGEKARLFVWSIFLIDPAIAGDVDLFEHIDDDWRLLYRGRDFVVRSLRPSRRQYQQWYNQLP